VGNLSHRVKVSRAATKAPAVGGYDQKVNRHALGAQNSLNGTKKWNKYGQVKKINDSF
jgi:hypothetical protein